MRFCGLCCILIEFREAGIFNKTLFITIALIALTLSGVNSVPLCADTCDDFTCGDANGDSIINNSDAVAIAKILSHLESNPSDCADSDGFDLLTLRDFFFVLRYTFSDGKPPSCVFQPKLLSASTSVMSISFNDVIQENDSVATLRLKLSNTLSLELIAFSLPLSIRIDGQTPLWLSVDASTSTLPRTPGLRIDSSAGTALILYAYDPISPGDYTICDLIVRVAPSPILRHVTLEYAEFGPYMTGVFEPPNSACNYVMFLDDSLNAWRPELVPTCMCGDADNNGQWTLSDAVYLLVYIFDDRHELTETCRGDANATGSTNISDVAYLINFLVGGGPSPHCPF